MLYPTYYICEVRHYQDSNVDLIRRSIDEFDWDRAFANKQVDKKVLISNKTVLNILSNFISHEVIVCDDKDLPWFYGKIKSLINSFMTELLSYRNQFIDLQSKSVDWFLYDNGLRYETVNEKLRTYNAYRKNIGNSQLRKNLSSLQQRLRDLIDDLKQKLY